MKKYEYSNFEKYKRLNIREEFKSENKDSNIKCEITAFKLFFDYILTEIAEETNKIIRKIISYIWPKLSK